MKRTRSITLKGILIGLSCLLPAYLGILTGGLLEEYFSTVGLIEPDEESGIFMLYQACTWMIPAVILIKLWGWGLKKWGVISQPEYKREF